jgi:hypothetical protein
MERTGLDALRPGEAGALPPRIAPADMAPAVPDMPAAPIAPPVEMPVEPDDPETGVEICPPVGL